MESSYKDWAREGKKIPPSGTGAQRKSKKYYEVLKQMSFLDGKLENRSVLSSNSQLQISTMAKCRTESGIKRKSIWDPHFNVVSEDTIVPKPDLFCSRKKKKSDEVLKQEMSGILSCVKDLTNVIKEGIESKNGRSAYELKINKFFEQLSEVQRDKLMETLLNVIFSESY